MPPMRKNLASWSLIGVSVLLAILSIFLEPNLANGTDTLRLNQPPSLNALLGTDHLGRSVVWRLCFATKAFVFPALLSMAVACVLALPMAAFAGYYDNWLRQCYLSLHGIISTIPRFVFILLVLSLYGSTNIVLAIAIGIAYTPTLSEAVFSRVNALRSTAWVRAHFAWGFSNATILWKFIVFRACSTTIKKHLANIFAYVLVVESTLSYLGSYGVQEPNPSLGNMIAFSWGYQEGNPLAFIAPMTLLLALVLSAHTISTRQKAQ